MYAFSDLDFMAGQAFPGMPAGINIDLDDWLKSGQPIRTARIRRRAAQHGRQPSYGPSRRDRIKAATARMMSPGCDWRAR